MTTHADINRAIAWAMHEVPGEDYLADESEARERFLGWARPQIEQDEFEVGGMAAAMLKSYGEVVTFVSLLNIMNRWANGGHR